MELAIINHLFQPLRDKPCWLVQPGYGSFLTFEFGAPTLTIDEPHHDTATKVPHTRRHRPRRVVRVHGAWHLWIYCCDWHVTSVGQLIADSTTARRRKRAAQELDGQILTHMAVSPANGASIFTFDLGTQLTTAPYDQNSEQWFLYEPSGDVFTMRADGMYSHNARHDAGRTRTMAPVEDPLSRGGATVRAQHAHAARLPSAREIVGILKSFCATRLGG